MYFILSPAPEGKMKSKAIKGEIPTPTADGKNQTVTVEVTYADGTKEDATVTIDYGEAKDAYVPEGQKVDVNKGEDPSAEAGIKNKDDLPEGTTYDWKTPVDTDTPGETTGTIVVTYPDGSKEEVEVTVGKPASTVTEINNKQVNNQQVKQTNNATKVTSLTLKTGDSTNLGMHTAVAFVSIVTLAGLSFVRKRRKVDEENKRNNDCIA